MKMLLSIIIAVIGSIAAIAVKGTAQTLIAAAIAFAPLALTLRSRKAARADSAKLFAAACEAVGMPLDAKFTHMEAGTVIVLNPQLRRMALAVGGDAKVYGYGDVREWSAQKESRGGSVGIGVAGTVAAGSASIAASRQADLNTGLFLTVRDVDHPLWRISMFEASDRARWAEILRQELSEGGVAA
nr:DUF4755 domain-containing protein [uncultured Duganella sp.]